MTGVSQKYASVWVGLLVFSVLWHFLFWSEAAEWRAAGQLSLWRQNKLWTFHLAVTEATRTHIHTHTHTHLLWAITHTQSNTSKAKPAINLHWHNMACHTLSHTHTHTHTHTLTAASSTKESPFFPSHSFLAFSLIPLKLQINETTFFSFKNNHYFLSQDTNQTRANTLKRWCKCLQNKNNLDPRSLMVWFPVLIFKMMG